LTAVLSTYVTVFSILTKHTQNCIQRLNPSFLGALAVLVSDRLPVSEISKDICLFPVPNLHARLLVQEAFATCSLP